MDELSCYAQRLVRVMSGPAPEDPRFVGETVDLTRVSDEELGALLAVARRVVPGSETAGPAIQTSSAVCLAAQERSPLFSSGACAELFAALADRAVVRAKHDIPSVPRFEQAVAAGALLRCTGPLPAELAEPAAVLAHQQSSDESRYARLALAKLAGDSVDREVAAQVRNQLTGDPLAREELDLLLGLDSVKRAVVAEANRHGSRDLAPLPDIIDRLAAIPEYVSFTRVALEAADARVGDIHAGRVPYIADKAFTVAEADVLWRACQVALLRDEQWLGDLLYRLLPGVVVAPTAAKTAPSQSASTVLAQAVDAWPTPEAVAALRQARRVVRHAGVAKKLDRALRTAEKGLARRPDVALRLPEPGAPTRAQLRTLTHALEGGYPLDTRYRYDRWWTELATRPHVGDLVRWLVWDIEVTPGRWQAVLPSLPAGAAEPVLTSVAGEPVPALQPQAAVRLWHPCRAIGQERAAWRDRIVALRLVQPFRQAFREHYSVDGATDTTIDLFAGHVVAIRPLLGLAVREGWRANHLDGMLIREFGPWRVVLAVRGGLFPGATGFGDVDCLHLLRRDGTQWRPAAFTDAPPVLVSEALRSVDLLVSVASFGLDEHPELRSDQRRWQMLSRLADRPLSETARMRRAALQRILTGLPGADALSFSKRHVHVGHYAVHLATARVTRDGEPVLVDLPRTTPASALPWLPYDERLLERITHTVVALANQDSPDRT